MAKQLDRFPGGGSYDWDQWLDGGIWLLTKGEDFEIDIESMRAAASRAAKQAGKKVRTRVIKEGEADQLAIQAYEPG